MFYHNKIKIKDLAKVKNYGKFYISILFILTFLLIVFNKADYIIVNKIKYLGADVISPVSKFITSPINVTTQAH